MFPRISGVLRQLHMQTVDELPKFFDQIPITCVESTVHQLTDEVSL